MINPEREFEWNRNEIVFDEAHFRREGAREERKRIIEMIQGMTKKPSAILLKIVERLSNDDF
jgi:hypothetical protein